LGQSTEIGTFWRQFVITVVRHQTRLKGSAMATQSNEPEMQLPARERQNAEIGRSGWAGIFAVDRPRNRLLLFAAAAFLAVVVLPLIAWIVGALTALTNGSMPAPVISGGSLANSIGPLISLAMIGIMAFPLGLLAPFGIRLNICLFCDTQAPQSPLLVPLYCLASLAYFGLPIVGSFPAPRRRKTFVVAFLIFVAMLITNLAGCALILRPAAP
jgi:hypothetical protein